MSFSVDGKPANCEGFAVNLRLDSQSLKPELSGQAFEIPAVFKKATSEWRDGQYVDISLTCNGYTFIFPNQHPAFVRQGDWHLGVAHPLYALSEYGYTHEFDRGAWLAYLIFEGEPGVVTFSSQPDPPVGLAEALKQEKLNASPERARDIAYVLSVFNVDYQNNREYLISLLNGCLSRPKESPEGDICNRDLLSFVTNLYWRGDTALLYPLLRIADTRSDVIGDIGTFYSDLLNRRAAIALDAMESLPVHKQALICRLAYEDDLYLDSPKRERVAATLRTTGTGSARRCLEAVSDTQP